MTNLPKLRELHLVSLASNLPGPVALARLVNFGVQVTKIEPPWGDPLAHHCPGWYRELTQGQQILNLNLKEKSDRQHLDEVLKKSHLLVSSFRPSALYSLGLDWGSLQKKSPHLNLVEIVGFADDPELPSHDLNYLARAGVLAPPTLPLSTYADLLGAEQTATQVIATLWKSLSEGKGFHCQVSLGLAAQDLARPLQEGLCRSGGPLGGGLPLYGIYRCQDGWLALAALEPEFVSTLRNLLGCQELSAQDLATFFRTQPTAYWRNWAKQHDLPLTAVENCLAPSP
ncbi:MAG: CoA transferase [Bdellovibrionales bacterium]|nr:CoA transferase [Bdellovibrionales bacterium]